MQFASDNWAGVHPQIAAALSTHASGFTPAYGGSSFDKAVYDRFNEIFEREVGVFFVATGTAANALSMATCNRVGGNFLCHTEAHMNVDEFGAAGFFTNGARPFSVPGPLGRMNPQALDQAIARFSDDLAHSGQAMAVSLTQATEVGTIHSLDDIAAISAVAKKHGLPLHMDGARFANALAALETTPAEMTWKRGVDIVSFGATKNGCWCADAIVVFDPDLAKQLNLLRKRAAMVFSKSLFVSAQFDAYFKDGLWLQMAANANAMAARLAAAFEDSTVARLAWLPQANEVFAILKKKTADKLRAAGATFHEWPAPEGFAGHLAEDEQIYRFVASFATTPDHVDKLGGLIG